MGVIAKEVKLEILGKVKSEERVSELSKQYGVCDRTIYAWLKTGVTNQVSLLELNRLKKENQMLKEIVGVLKYQNNNHRCCKDKNSQIKKPISF